MAHDNRLVTGEINARWAQQRLSIKGGSVIVSIESRHASWRPAAAVGIVSSLTWRIGTSVEANLWPCLVVKGLDYYETNHGRSPHNPPNQEISRAVCMQASPAV